MGPEETATIYQRFIHRLEQLPVRARRLLCLIARQAYHGPLRSKTPGMATMPEIHEACGLDVDEFYEVLRFLQSARFVTVEDNYPFEELKLTGESDAGAAVLQMILSCCETANV